MSLYYLQYEMHHNYYYTIVKKESNSMYNTDVVLFQSPTYTSYIAPVVFMTPQATPQTYFYPGPFDTEYGAPSFYGIPSTPYMMPVPYNNQNGYYYPQDYFAPSVDNYVDESYYVNGSPTACFCKEEEEEDPYSIYLAATPKLVFCTPRMLPLDPNTMIDEFCKQENMNEHASWILDLEFGIPRVPTTRAMPVYDLEYNNIHCKNIPAAIHPAFESCNIDFKRELLFYYKCIMSIWYQEYKECKIIYCDKSIKNFQEWIKVPMEKYGMCWR